MHKKGGSLPISAPSEWARWRRSSGETSNQSAPAFSRTRSLYFRRAQGRASWFVDVEPGLATLALVVKESWQSLRTVRVRARWQDELAALIARESCLVDSPADCPRLVHASP